MTRKSTFLSRREWLEIPFQKYPREIFHHFLDLMFRFASILEANDKTKLISPVDDRYRGHIATDCEDLRGAFVLWHEKFTNQSPNRQYYIEIPAFGLVTEDYRSARPVFASYLQFANLADPSAVMTYWYPLRARLLLVNPLIQSGQCTSTTPQQPNSICAPPT